MHSDAKRIYDDKRLELLRCASLLGLRSQALLLEDHKILTLQMREEATLSGEVSVLHPEMGFYLLLYLPLCRGNQGVCCCQQCFWIKNEKEGLILNNKKIWNSMILPSLWRLVLRNWTNTEDKVCRRKTVLSIHKFKLQIKCTWSGII